MSKRKEEIGEYAEKNSVEQASEKYGISRETVKRYKRIWKSRNKATKGNSFDEKLMEQVRERFSDKELKALISGSVHKPNEIKPIHSFKGEDVTIGLFTDLHLGSKYTNPDNVYEAFDIFAKEDVDFVACCGDIFEGVSHRPGHVYECSHYGYTSQLEHGIEVFSEWVDTPIYSIDGNHDRWYIKNCGAKIVQELDNNVENFHFIGHDEADIHLDTMNYKTPTVIKLWHGEDSGSYAGSYRLQKLIESFTGGEKPHILFAGHTHKSLYIYDRHVHCVSAGSIQKQSKWMRGKRLPAHTGFWVIKLKVNELGVSSFMPRFYPFYV